MEFVRFQAGSGVGCGSESGTGFAIPNEAEFETLQEYIEKYFS